MATAPPRPSAATLRQLRAFVAVAQDGSITRAAQRLHLTPSALSMLVSGLEGEWGVRLFERTTRRLVLTEAGREVLPGVEAVLAQLDQTIDALRQRTEQRGARLSVATSPLLAATWVPQLMATFRARHPGVTLLLQDVSVDEVAPLVRAGEADIGLCTADSSSPDLSQTLLYRDRLLLACPVAHPLASQREVRWADLAGEPLVLLRRGSGLRQLAEQGLAALGAPVAPAFEVAQVGTAIGLVEAGLGLSVLPWYALSSARHTGVCGVPLTDPVLERDIVALSAGERPLSPAGHAFVAHAQQHLQATAAAGQGAPSGARAGGPTRRRPARAADASTQGG